MVFLNYFFGGWTLGIGGVLDGSGSRRSSNGSGLCCGDGWGVLGLLIVFILLVKNLKVRLRAQLCFMKELSIVRESRGWQMLFECEMAF